MPARTEVFISATSGDLGEARQLVKDALLTMGCFPVEQTNFSPDYRTVQEKLKETIESCQAVLHIVGHRYGAEPDPAKLPANERRRSYTQMEYDLAQSLKKEVYVFLCSNDFPFDDCEPEAADKQQLQRVHRDSIMSGEKAWTDVATREALKIEVGKIKIDLRNLQQQDRSIKRRVLIGIGAVVIALAAIVYSLFRARQDVAAVGEQVQQVANVTKRYENPKLLAERMRENIRKKAEAELAAARQRGATWDEIRELERQRDSALDHADELIRTIQKGLAGKPDAIFQEASRILADEGADAALGYLGSHEEEILARVDRLAARGAEARPEIQQAIERAPLPCRV